MRKRITRIFAVVLVLSGARGYAQTNFLDWDTAIAQATAEKKIVVIDVYTDWCGWCKRMDKDTYNNEKVSAMLNENFKAVKINPEKPGVYKLAGKEYSSRDLVATLSNNGVRGYPSTLFLVPHANNKAELSVGYKPADAFLTELNNLRVKYGSGPATQTKN
jgi:uncharacterized protein YyaL (SSP411 family)